MANEKRLIDANALLDKIRNSTASEATKVTAFVFADTAPTVDAVEVVHGRCVYVRDDELIDHWECSVCGKYIPWEYHRDCNYCPNCGAKMDGDGNG